MIEYIKKHTIAFVEEIDLQSKNYKTVNLSEYKYSDYSDYLIYIIHDSKVISSSQKKLVDKIITLESDKDLSENNHFKVYIVVLPINNKFSNDFLKIESKIFTVLGEINKFEKGLSQFILISHLALPLLAMLLLSSAVTSYAYLFNIPIDMIDMASQVNMLYSLLLSILVGLTHIFTKPLVLATLIGLSFFFSPILGIFFKRKLYKLIYKAPRFLLKSLETIKHTQYLYIKGIYAFSFAVLFVMTLDDIERIQFPVLEQNQTKSNYVGQLLHKKNNLLFNTLLKYHNTVAFPQYIKTELNEYILVKAVKDDLVYFYTFNDLFSNLNTQENNESLRMRLCIDSYETQMYENDLNVGLAPPKSNIAPTSILVNSKNVIEIFYERATAYKENLCQ